jgi:hypothetical protein
MEFLESDEFTRRIVKLGLESELSELQNELRDNPRAGMLDPGTCGVRKIRMRDATRGQGKRFGTRVHYAYNPRKQTIYLMNVYSKGEQGTLSAEQKKALRRRLRLWGAE